MSRESVTKGFLKQISWGSYGSVGTFPTWSQLSVAGHRRCWSLFVFFLVQGPLIINIIFLITYLCFTNTSSSLLSNLWLSKLLPLAFVCLIIFVLQLNQLYKLFTFHHGLLAKLGYLQGNASHSYVMTYRTWGNLNRGKFSCNAKPRNTTRITPPKAIMAIAGKSSFLVGDASSNGWFFIVMLVFQGVLHCW